MKSHGCARAGAHGGVHGGDAQRHRHPCRRRSGFLRRWFLANSLIAGILGLFWLVFRSGSKPSRLAYPCQQAALSAATLAFGAPLVAAAITARRGLAAALRKPAGLVAAGLGLVLTAGIWGYASRADEYRGPKLNPRADYRAQVYHVSQCPEDPSGDRFLGLDNLLALMGREGLKLYNSSTQALMAGPDGIIASDDIVVIKINYQWGERGGTNTDLLRGLVRRIVDHPDTFTGEIVVCENTQFAAINGFNRSRNNAQDITQSPHDIVVALQDQGHAISHYSWTGIRLTSVDEYSAGDATDGYVVGEYDAALHGRVSYPKFQTSYGTHISLRYGVWDPGSETYDRQRLKFINAPVLKSHHAVYGATACVKNYMGVVTDSLGTNSHLGTEYGILGALQGQIQPANLNILDCIWINANPYDGPWTTYGAATRRDELIASVDPVAADMWAVTNILIPGFIDNLYSPPWPYPSADPEDPGSRFRTYLDNSMNYILAAGYDATNDLGQIDLISGNGGAGDFAGDGAVDLSDYDQFALCFTGPDGGPVEPGCQPGDFDGDGDIDCDDWSHFVVVWTEPESPPALSQCPTTSIPTVSEWGLVVMVLLLPTAGTIILRQRHLLQH